MASVYLRSEFRKFKVDLSRFLFSGYKNNRDLELETILKTELEEVKFDECEDQVGSLDGGIVIKSENSIIITPMCCGDIGNLREWEKILESQNNIWKQLWIGHPWIFYRRANGFIEISNYTESNLDDFNDIQVEYKLTEEEFF
ncbi:Uncharacterized protein A9P81_4066 [Leptospira interrogans serovar Copenhageni/Icterohaemorrhagiae]|nr:Uncharacterized protein A9P81_4066 [Leptospira interrogans serovar Copenhageni/Icterohaemorrhagiae]OCA00715.1 Uncharacterized protein A9P81_1115 [Leptospira interrogans serovar Copenhageni/Icterohaemorrhagiae]